MFLTSLFPEMGHLDAQAVSKSWPTLMIALFGDPAYAFTDIYAWMNLQVYHITLWMIFGVFAALLASEAVAKEIGEKTMDILLSTKVTRAGVILSRMTAIFIILAISIMPSALGTALGAVIAGYEIKFGLIMISSMLVFMISLIFAALTVLVSVLVPKQTLSAFLTIAFLGTFFLYEDLSKLSPFLSKFAFIFPFHYYNPQDVLIYGSFSFLEPLILACIFVLLTTVSAALFSKKDILL